MILTSADVTVNGWKQHVPTYNTSLAILESTPQSGCNTGPLFDENGQHRSLLKKRFIILETGAFYSIPCSNKGLRECSSQVNSRYTSHVSSWLLMEDNLIWVLSFPSFQMEWKPCYETFHNFSTLCVGFPCKFYLSFQSLFLYINCPWVS